MDRWREERKTLVWREERNFIYNKEILRKFDYFNKKQSNPQQNWRNNMGLEYMTEFE